MKALPLLALLAVTTVASYGQPTNGAVYWSTTMPDCSALAGESAVTITDTSGNTLGYSCYVSGAFVWLAAGGGWNTSIRVAAPASAPIGVDYTFYDTSGNDLSVDSTFDEGTAVTSNNDVNFALYANQPAEVDVAGATSGAPSYTATTTGSAYAIFYCPDANTCNNVYPQLLYSALPSSPWSISVPIAWDTQLSTQWSAEGIDDGVTQNVSLAIYNESQTATAYTVDIYDTTGTLVGSAMTPVIPPLQPLSGGALGQGGTYGVILSDLITTPLPSGVFKILIDGGASDSAVEVLQFNGPSATSLQVAYDTAPLTAAAKSAAKASRAKIQRTRVQAQAKRVFLPLKLK